MFLINQINNIIELSLNFILSINFIIILVIFILSYSIVKYYIRDRKYITTLKEFREIERVTIEDLKDRPLVNIIIPAWKEGEIFNGCLLSIMKLTYPKLNIIVNAGGSEETISIANSFKKHDNFTIINQKEGEGKIKAINDCLKYISEGIVYLIDADIYLDDEIFFQMLYSIINNKEKVTVSRTKPHKSIQNKDLAKYLYFNRNPWFSHQFSLYSKIITQNTILSYEIIDKVSPFSEGISSDDNLVIGLDIRNKGYKIINIQNMVESFNFPIKIKDYYTQNLRWIENSQIFNLKNNKIKFFKFFFVFLISICLLIFSFLLFVNLYLFLFGFLILLSYYLKKIRKVIFYKLNNKKDAIPVNFKFFFKLIYYIYIDALVVIIAFFEILFYRKAYKKRKNLF